jgi:acyl-CoA reductase-like NAD-dependent aldehyde dehydrogenase
MSTDIVLVSQSVKQTFSDLLHAKLASFSECHVTRVISRKSEQRIQALVADAVAKGAVVHTPSPELNVAARNVQDEHDERKCLRATIMDNLSPDMEFWTEESFGPLLGIAACAGLEDASEIIGGCRYGLSAAIFSRSGLRLVRAASQINTGAVHINGATVHDEPALPHGGCRDSGWGRFGGHWALLEFTEARTVIINDSTES